MLDEKQLALLLESLRSHGIPFEEKDIQRALNTQSEPLVGTWIDEHLQPETLLTRDELSLYSALQRSGEGEILALSQELSLVSGHWDSDVQRSIEQLEKSTIAIDKHTEILRTQQEVVATLVNSNGQENITRVAAESARFRAWLAENNQTRCEADALLQTLKYQMAELAGLCRNADVGLKKTASEILRGDDKLLLGLQKLASNLQTGDQEEDGAAERIRGLCARLIKYTVEGVRTRLDRIYLEAVSGSRGSPQGSGDTGNAEVGALVEELESLYSEILPVAQMSTEQQFLEPALRLITSHAVRGSDRTNKSIDYISKCLSNLMERLQHFTIETQEYKSYRAATMRFASAVKPELDADAPKSPRVRQPSSPSRSRKHGKSISPALLRNTRRRSSGTSFDDDVNHELQILRNLGISLTTESTNDRDVATTLRDVLLDRTAKLNGHTKSLQEVLEASVGSHLHDSQITLQLLMESLHSETQFKSVSLLDGEVQEALNKLESGVETVRREIGAVNMDSLRERNVRRDDLVDRWAR